MSLVWKIVAFTLLGIVAIVVGLGAMLSREWRVSESLLIAASPATLHPLVEDFGRWSEWATKNSKRQLSYEYGGTEKGVGAVQIVSGGAEPGRMTITASDPLSGIEFESSRDGEVTGRGAIRYSEAGAMTEVTWEERGVLPAVVGPFIRDPTQKQIGAYFRVALTGLKDAAEAAQSEQK